MFEVFRRDPGPRFLLAQPVGAMGIFFFLSCIDSSSHLATLLVLAPSRRLINKCMLQRNSRKWSFEAAWMVRSCSEGGWYQLASRASRHTVASTSLSGGPAATSHVSHGHCFIILPLRPHSRSFPTLTSSSLPGFAATGRCVQPVAEEARRGGRELGKGWKRWNVPTKLIRDACCVYCTKEICPARYSIRPPISTSRYCMRCGVPVPLPIPVQHGPDDTYLRSYLCTPVLVFQQAVVEMELDLSGQRQKGN
ncbi:hypothetical protein F5Y01DRAFT_122157 [Xylaria sp. FL0043]|nr:hypothetical protein F5Y01DRAFT_122157 [Xylaria sp. FL0043]